jgi:hypothetical protein
MYRRGVILGLTRVIVFLLPITIILLVPLMRIGIHAMANIRGRYASLDILYAKLDLFATLLVNLKDYIAGKMIKASGVRLKDK